MEIERKFLVDGLPASLDKFLKVARILKRRTVSKELAANQRVIVNGRIAKPSTDIKAGDIIEVIFRFLLQNISSSECRQFRAASLPHSSVRRAEAEFVTEFAKRFFDRFSFTVRRRQNRF